MGVTVPATAKADQIRPVTTDEVQVSVTGKLLRETDLLLPCGPRVIDDRSIGHSTVEVAVRIILGLIAIGYALAREPLPEPFAFDLSQVSYQTKQRHR